MADIKDFKVGTIPMKPQIGEAIRPSGMHTRVTWLKEVTSEDADGGKLSSTFVPVMDLWCNLQFLVGSRLLYAQQESSEAQMWVTIRYRREVVQGARFATIDGRHIFTVLTPPRDPEYKHQQLVCTCRELQVNES